MDAVLLDSPINLRSEDATIPLPADGAPSPFNKPNADVILHSLDGVEFFVRSHILIEASPWFEAHLSLPISSPTHLTLDAHSATLETLLRICYPIPKPQSQRTVEDIESALRIAEKYKLDLPVVVLEEELLDMARRGFALEVWALACRLSREDLGRRAAQCTFNDHRFDIRRIGSLHGVSAGDYFRLREYHCRRGQVAPQFVLCRSSLGPSEECLKANDPAPLSPAPPSPAQSINEAGIGIESFEKIPRPQSFCPDIPYPDLVCVASDGAHLYVHRKIVAGASSSIAEILSQHDIPITVSYETTAKLTKVQKRKLSKIRSVVEQPEIHVKESSDVLAVLFQLCYPGDRTMPITPSACLTALAAAIRLGMPRIVTELEAHWQALVKQDPLRAYFAAARAGQNARAEEAAKCVVYRRLDEQYIPEMESTPLLPYHLLTAYCDQCHAAAQTLLRKACIPPRTAPQVLSGQEHPVADDVSTKQVERSPEDDDWLQAYLDELYTTGEDNPGQGVLEALLEKASVSGQWCHTCESLAQRLSSVARAVQSIPSVVGTIKFEWA